MSSHEVEPKQIYMDPDDLPDEGEALNDGTKVPDLPRKTAGELMADAPEAVLGGLGATSLAN